MSARAKLTERIFLLSQSLYYVPQLLWLTAPACLLLLLMGKVCVEAEAEAEAEVEAEVEVEVKCKCNDRSSEVLRREIMGPG